MQTASGGYSDAMRTTLVIDDDVLDVARDIARAQHRSLGEVISTLARRGLRPGSRIARRENGAPYFVVSPDARPITPADVERAMDDW